MFNNSGLFFLPLCTRLVNDESVNCRKLTAVAIKALIEKVGFKEKGKYNVCGVSLYIHTDQAVDTSSCRRKWIGPPPVLLRKEDAWCGNVHPTKVCELLL